MSMMDQLAATREILAASEGVDLTPFDDLTNTYGTVEEGFQLKLAEKDRVIEELSAEIAKLKAANYDLMIATPAPEEAPIDGDGDGDVDEDGDGDEDSGGVDSLFDDDDDED